MHQLTRRLATALALLALTACAPSPDRQSGAYRKAGTPIYSSAVLQPARLAGQWRQVAGFAPAPGGCAPGGARIEQTATGLAIDYHLCLSGQVSRGRSPMQPAGPGRFAVKGQSAPWWVLWADADYRTVVIGTPSGGFGFILNRDGALPPDRLAAAREILDWNGYDLRQLQIYR